MKRAMDILLALFALIMLSPLLVVVALAIMVESGFPVFFSQTRIGRGGQNFQMIKFRSMSRNAAGEGPYFTAVNDARITRIGRWIRRTSIDELPQILNVLKADMSLVGPRPDVPEQQSLYAPQDWERRHRVRPGITGLAQVNGRSDTSFEQRLADDLAYASSWSWHGDIRIMWLTLMRLGGKQSN